ncbi:hypothetical protein [Cupriavidus sp. CuC1]|uniref:hypothetical protein n=1 Tax=Cupriavidus sp. CuC1 TaxID=3373131 RepID=UPI0037D62312
MVCSTIVKQISSTYSYDGTDLRQNSTQWNCHYWDGTYHQPSYINLIQNGTCAPGDTLSGSTCTYVPPPPVCTDAAVKARYLGASVQGTSASLPSTICIQGCAYSGGAVGVQSGTSYASDVGMGTGATCSPANYDTLDTTTKPTDPPSLVSCQKRGMTYGTVNGVGICAKAGTVPNTTVTKNDSSTSQATDASGVQAAPQTTNTVTNVTNVNGVPTVTQTKTNPDGSKTSTTQPQDGFCASNPNDKVCKGTDQSQASGGDDCTAPPVCNGDAVQCMMVKQEYGTRCDNQKPNDASALGTKILAGQDPVANPADHANRTSTPISNSLDQTAFLGASGGLSDKVFTVSGQAITFPFSRLNQYLVWIGRLFVVMSLIGALRIVLGGFKK